VYKFKGLAYTQMINESSWVYSKQSKNILEGRKGKKKEGRKEEKEEKRKGKGKEGKEKNNSGRTGVQLFYDFTLDKRSTYF
jgi:hypothetical protein